MNTWTQEEVLAAVKGEGLATSTYPEVYAGIFTDTRAVVAGGLFVPLVGERFDGHNFVAQALQAGAGAALWARPDIPAELAKAPLIRVTDTLDAFQALGSFNQKRWHIPAIAITGSVGKTTTKDLVKFLLSYKSESSRSYRVHATPVNHNNDVGAAQTLLELSEQDEIAVIEMGMRGRGQVRRLARLVDAQVGIITAIGESHLEILGSREAIAEAKAELFEEMPASSLAIYPADSPYASILRERINCRPCPFSLQADSAAAWRLLQYQPEVTERGLGSRVRLAFPGGEVELSYSRPGLHNVSNLLAALAACWEYGIAPQDVAEALTEFQPTGMRAEVVPLANHITLLNDAYNAAPSSMRGALEVMEQIASYRGTERLPQKRRCVAVLGDMLELGAGSAEFHRQMGEACAQYGVAQLIGVGSLSAANMVPAAQAAGVSALSVANREEAWECLQRELRPHDVVLIKASHSIGLEFLAEKLADYQR